MRIIEIKVKTKALSNEIITIQDNKKYLVNITIEPEKGKANKKLISLLAKFFKVHQKNIEIIKGIKTKNKIIRIN